jgi:hypothetical protein
MISIGFVGSHALAAVIDRAKAVPRPNANAFVLKLMCVSP